VKTDAGKNDHPSPTAPMRDSGIEWIGEIPEGWDVNRLRFHATIKVSNVDKKTVEGEFPVQLCNYTDVYYQERITDALEFMVATATASQKHQFALISGDVLLTKDSETAEDIGVSALVVGRLRNVVLGYHLALLRGYPDNLESRFLHWQLKATIAKDQLSLSATGVTRFGLRQESIASLQLILPPPAQQRAIADFLDRETSRIDTLIAKRQRIIGLLDEKRSALITQAVTKGLDPTAPMRDTGIEWIGEIPEGWKATRLKNILQASITDGPHTTPIFEDEGVPFLSVDGIQDGELIFDQCRYITEQEHKVFRTKTLPRRDDILMGKAASTGKIARVKVDFEFSIWSPLALIRLNTAMSSPTYVEYTLKSSTLQAQIDVLCTSNTQKNISMDDIPKLMLAFPPLAEQRAIADFLDRETSRIDQLKSLNQRQIELLKEKRQALITAAVTGKIPEARGVA